MADIILLEPDTILANVYASALAAAGHSVRTVISAQEAVFEADSCRPELVIAELQLVAHSGIEFLYEFRSYPEWQGIPVLVNSIVPPVEFALSNQLLSEGLGVGEYLYKPQASLRMLLRAVERLLTPAAVSTGSDPVDDDTPELAAAAPAVQPAAAT